MRIPAFRFAWLLTLVATAGISTGTNGNSREPEIQQIAGYRQWQRLTEKPIAAENPSIGG
jgi:hypothetical protein